MFGLGRLWRGGEGVGYMLIRFYVHEVGDICDSRGVPGQPFM